ncbi:uncharacterized protein PITG_08441 [Phytophthora infestans T30-4]|uniref:WD domain-containing protein n=1 Tax=Phytophthora infestans (strain T30-4) TaxID=403677 RepID=D0NAM1_PHYIT|nr:uncharacterized protein PITG_08441 [Phytophthora infestans T30-4]EEY54879.1 conserved hypothetical protein [Phytophthora infestans T30-4]|eukprot:XP_002903824.1 conserved hypothetical protein [Phytophthora infestans T30-4]
MRVLVGDETGLLKSIELEKNEQRILSSRVKPQARSRSIQRLCWYADERDAADFQRNVVLARADGVVESYEAITRAVWDSTSSANSARWCNARTRATCCMMRLESATQTVIGVGGKEHDLNLWSLETQQVLFKAKNVTHDKLDMRVPVWVKDLRFLSSPGNSNGHRVIVGTGHRHVRIYDSNTKRRPVQQLDNFGENPIQSLCVSPDETQVYVGDTAGNLDILDLRTLKHMGRCTGPVGSIRDIACHPTLPYIAAVGLDRMVHVFDVNSRKYRHTIYAKQRLNSVLFCADGLKDIPVADDKPSRKKQKSGDEEMTFDDDDDEMEEEEYEGLEISDNEEEDDEADSDSD